MSPTSTLLRVRVARLHNRHRKLEDKVALAWAGPDASAAAGHDRNIEGFASAQWRRRRAAHARLLEGGPDAYATCGRLRLYRDKGVRPRSSARSEAPGPRLRIGARIGRHGHLARRRHHLSLLHASRVCDARQERTEGGVLLRGGGHVRGDIFRGEPRSRKRRACGGLRLRLPTGGDEGGSARTGSPRAARAARRAIQASRSPLVFGQLLRPLGRFFLASGPPVEAVECGDRVTARCCGKRRAGGWRRGSGHASSCGRGTRSRGGRPA